MSAVIQNYRYSAIEVHPAWLGAVSGLEADKLLRGKNSPYLYVLRPGECKGSYYVTFVHPDGYIKHTPFNIYTTAHGTWWYENTGGGGEYKEEMIDDVIHLIMHCEKDECTPYITK